MRKKSNKLKKQKENIKKINNNSKETSIEYNVFKEDNQKELKTMKKNKNNKKDIKNNKKDIKNNKKDIKNIKNINIINNENKIKNKKINNVKINLIFILIFCLVVYFVILISNLVKNPIKTFIVTKGTISKEENAIGYIIREETIIQGKKQKNGMIKLKEEGEKVAKGNSIFRYYSSDEKTLKEKINNMDKKIQEVMEKQENILPSDIKLIENEIENKLNLIYGINNMQKIEEYKKEINFNIAKKAKIVGEKSPSGSYLKELIDEREKYEKELNDVAESVNATSSGVVSYRVDNLENVLKKDDYSNINKKFLESLNLKTGRIVKSNEEKGKIINNFDCDIAFNSNSKESKKVKIGDIIKIRLANSEIIKAKVKKIIEEEDKTRTLIININKNVEKINQYRKISFDIIWWNEEGYRVPNEAIISENDLNYVVRNRNGYYNKMLIKILKQNDEFSIISKYKGEELKNMGYTNNQIYDMKNIALYDEIVINPTKEQLLQ